MREGSRSLARTGSAKLRRVLRAEEARIAALPHEEASAYTLDGVPIFEGVTQRRTSDVHLTRHQLSRLQDAVLTHNHPKARSFSDTDVGLAIDADLAEIRAVGVTPDGRRCTYRMRRPANAWPSAARTWETYLRVRDAVTAALAHAVATGQMTESEALFVLRHEIWRRLGDALGITYRRRLE